jgi:hypothetical protein
MNETADRVAKSGDGKIHVVRGGARSVYEVIESADDVSVTIRYAGDHKEKLTLLKSTVPSLADTLSEITRKMAGSGSSNGGQKH